MNTNQKSNENDKCGPKKRLSDDGENDEEYYKECFHPEKNGTQNSAIHFGFS